MVIQFRVPHTTQCRGSRALAGWTRDADDEPIAENVQEVVKDTMHMVANSDMPCLFECIECPIVIPCIIYV